ncbi:MAG: hypothetical protein AB4290_10080 [Spirulina sp.]
MNSEQLLIINYPSEKVMPAFGYFSRSPIGQTKIKYEHCHPITLLGFEWHD